MSVMIDLLHLTDGTGSTGLKARIIKNVQVYLVSNCGQVGRFITNNLNSYVVSNYSPKTN